MREIKNHSYMNHQLNNMDCEPVFDKLHAARTHEESRRAICCSCGRKVKKTSKSLTPVKEVSSRFESLVQLYVYSEFSVKNVNFSTALCDTCRLALVALEKVILLFSHI